MTETSISKAFSSITDPRIDRTKRHPLVNIITISICAVICGCEDFSSIEEYGKSKQDWFSEILDMPHGIPSHDTFSDVLNRLSPKEFSTAFTRWVTQLGNLKDDVVAIDGKVMRRTLDKARGNPAIHLVSAWSVKNNVCFGQVRVSDKSNEITAIPVLLELLDIKDATITTDAMGCQFEITNKIVEKKADFVLALKGNQGEFHDDIKKFMDDQIEKECVAVGHDFFESVNGDHGRIEQRKVWVTNQIDWLQKRHPKWSTVKSIAVVDSMGDIKGKISQEKRYFISSHEHKSAEFIGHAIRSHWSVENKLHWQLDVSFNEDQSRLRSGNAAQNFSMMNKIALNLLKNERTVKVGIKNKRLKSGWDNDYMMKVLTVGFTSV